MHERRLSDPPPASLKEGNSKPEGKTAAANEFPHATAKSTSFRQSKSFSSKDSNFMTSSKVSKCSETRKISDCNLQKVCDPPSIVQNGVKSSKSHGFSSKSEGPQLSKPLRQTAKADAAQPALNRSNDSSLNRATGEHADRNATFKETPPKAAKEISPKPAKSLAQAKSFSLSLSVDPQKKLPPIKTSHTSSFKSPSSAKNTANLCVECKAEAEGTVCFIGNDGRVSACSSRTAFRLCKNLKCANHNPELLESSSAAAGNAGPKKYLISRRHSLNIRPRSTTTSGKNEKPDLDKKDPHVLDHKMTPSPHGAFAATLPRLEGDDDLHGCNEFDVEGELENDTGSHESLSAKVAEIDGTASASPHHGRSVGQYQRMRRRSFNVFETHAPAELVTLRKQMMQERKQAEEWMLDYAIEEALQKLVPSKDSKVKALVEAFESIMPNKEADAGTAEGHEELPKIPSKRAIKT